MINISRFNDVQDRIYDRVEEYITRLRNVIEQTSSKPLELFLLNSDMNKMYRLYTIDEFYQPIREGHCDEDGEIYEAVSWDTIQQGLYDEIKQFEIATVNSRNGKMSSKKDGQKQRFDYENYKEIGARVIAIGGLVLSRGLTLEGLMVSYYSRNAGAYDTLLQMCRWFGYRPKYQDLCRVYMTQVNIDSFSAVLAAVDNLKAQFAEMEAQKKRPNDFGLMVREAPESLETTLLVTARNKMRATDQIVYQLNYGGVYADTSKLLKTAAQNSENYAAFKELYETLSFSDVHGRYMARGVWKQQIADFISKLKIHYANKKFDVEGLSEYISESEIFEYWDVVIATGDSKRFVNFMGVDKLSAATRSFHTAGSSDKFIRIGGSNNRVLDPGILDSGLGLTSEKRGDILAKINSELKPGEKPHTELTAKDYLRLREHPILVIYPLDLLTKTSNKEVQARFNDETDEHRKAIEEEKEQLRDRFGDIPLMAFAVAFPAKESSKKFIYRANLRKIKELTDNLEVTDDEEGEDVGDDQL